MKVTSVKVTTVETDNLKAYASICLDDSLIINGVRVFSKNDELYIVMPAKKSQGGQYHDFAYATSQELKDHIKETVLAAYAQTIQNA